MLSEVEARTILEAAHIAWTRRDIEEVLAQYTDDLTFWCNAGDPSGGPVSITGKAAFREALLSILNVTTCRAYVLSFSYDGEIGRATARHRVQHLASGFVLEGAFRQVVHYRDAKISRLEEYHDAGRFTAFWKVVAQGGTSNTFVWQPEKSQT